MGNLEKKKHGVSVRNHIWQKLFQRVTLKTKFMTTISNQRILLVVNGIFLMVLRTNIGKGEIFHQLQGKGNKEFVQGSVAKIVTKEPV